MDVENLFWPVRHLHDHHPRVLLGLPDLALPYDILVLVPDQHRSYPIREQIGFNSGENLGLP